MNIRHGVYIILGIFILWLALFIGIGLYADITKPSINNAQYIIDGYGLLFRYTNNITCKDCVSVEVNGYYEFSFPNWVYHDTKLTTEIASIHLRK